ncbi:MAG: hypothetical protein HKL80_03825 [Acidimicrobiales bacterium]|nr:hypothetical protein [Acidimicrobiales bacterium]
MPKTIATTPSWYWPDGVPRVLGTPPYFVEEAVVERWLKHSPEISLLGSISKVLSARELAEQIEAIAGNLNILASSSDQLLAVVAGPTLDGAVLTLGAIASSLKVLLIPSEGDIKSFSNDRDLKFVCDEIGAEILSNLGINATNVNSLKDPIGQDQAKLAISRNLNDAVIGLPFDKGVAWHSHRSVLAGAISMQAFYSSEQESTWAITYSPCSWQGLVGMITALLNGSTCYFTPSGQAGKELGEMISPRWLFSSIEDALDTWVSGGRKKKSNYTTGQSAIVGINGVFSSDARRDIDNSVGSALTLLGSPVTFAMLGAHPSWYLDEAAGIALPNMHVTPADPDNGEPITTLWELIDEAMISAWAPSLAPSLEGEAVDRLSGKRYLTGVLAASDPNGMLYVLDD